MTQIIAPALIRGATIATDLVEFGGRSGEASFRAPNPATLLSRLPLRDPSKLRDLYTLRFADILDYLVELGERLDLSKNAFVQEALEQSYAFSDSTPSLLRASYAQIPFMFTRGLIREMAEQSIGVDCLDGWGERTLSDGRVASVRPMGARALHIVAGNAPAISAISIIRNAITRSDAIIKAPSNDPLTTLAIARTMGAMAPDHPITKHLACAYWKGGDQSFEEQLYRPANLEKIVAWGGFASVKHVTKYIQPGLELISLDPKRSATLIGPEAFTSEATMRNVAERAATDVGAYNQLTCVNARVIYVVTGTNDEGLARADRFGHLIYESMMKLPGWLSTRVKRFDPELRANIDSVRGGDFYKVIGGESDEGAIIISHLDAPVDFSRSLSGRVANLVPIDDPMDSLRGMDAYTQTVGIYPETLRRQMRDLLPLYGAQRIVSLGYACSGNPCLPQDAIEPVRRMVKWIVDESCDPSIVQPLWSRPVDTGERKSAA